MRLVPRQLQRSGMTGSVPYYGGRLSPAQAYSAAHPNTPLPPGRLAGTTTPQDLAVANAPAPTGTFAPPPGVHPGTPVPADDRAALRRLAAAGVITAAELATIEGRMA